MTFDALLIGLIAGFALGLFVGAILFARRRSDAAQEGDKK